MQVKLLPFQIKPSKQEQEYVCDFDAEQLPITDPVVSAQGSPKHGS